MAAATSPVAADQGTTPAQAPLMITAGNDQDQNDLQSIDLFSVRRPKHAIAGLSSGLKNIGKGLASGVAALVAMPIQGAKEEGVKGFSKGLLVGAVSGVALAVAGTATGILQVGRGIVNTPEAIKGGLSDQVWNPETREWYYYSLSEEAAQVLQNEGLSGANNAPSRNVIDTTFYDELGISPNATQQQIKKAYRLKAIQLHPDKNPDDEKASEKFQQLGNAYQILSDESLRARYHQVGIKGVDEHQLLDSAQVFELVFGSQHFENYVGELRLMQISGALSSVNPEGNEQDQQEAIEIAMERAHAQSKERQTRREVQCAVNLAAKLDQYVNHGTEDRIRFKTAIESEAKELSSGSAFGGTLIGVLGHVYEEQASAFLGFRHNISAGIGLTNVKKSAHVLANKYRVMSSALKAYNAAKQAQKEEAKQKEKRAKQAAVKGEELQEDEANSNNSIPAGSVDAILETIWNITVLDVESTIRNVCQKLFTDSSIPIEARRERARGLLVIASAFQKVSQSSSAGLLEFKSKFSEPPVQA